MDGITSLRSQSRSLTTRIPYLPVADITYNDGPRQEKLWTPDIYFEDFVSVQLGGREFNDGELLSAASPEPRTWQPRPVTDCVVRLPPL